MSVYLNIAFIFDPDTFKATDPQVIAVRSSYPKTPAKTPELVAHIREQFPSIPLIATGGPSDESIMKTIRAGANAITYTPPSTAQLFASMMDKYRGDAQ